ncbi:MAG: type I-C CRISPR-associated endonuclease Cas1c [Oscillospiraceae bacterium]|nr:type I-C CRISPR-associated endonuclease Cas1c [Oscillospiraceae bacterium]
MKKLLNTLFITSEDVYLTLDGENVVGKRENQVVARFPLHTLGGIVSFSYAGASPALMGACAERAITMSFCTPRGRFLARSSGAGNGNVLLRRAQYRVADDSASSCQIARLMIFGKVFNARWSVERTCRDHALRVDVEKLKAASSRLRELLPQIQSATDLEALRGFEGVGAAVYFGVMDDLILNRKNVFSAVGRTRRPPLDPLNALLSFSYTLLAHDCASALESVGLDSYVGFLHRDRPGRTSLALDLMEELRPCMADRFVLTCINNRMFDECDFEFRESGAVLLTDTARKTFLKGWQERRSEQITHPYLSEKLEWGMVPNVQALLLARHLRGDIETYPPFLWK